MRVNKRNAFNHTNCINWRAVRLRVWIQCNVYRLIYGNLFEEWCIFGHKRIVHYWLVIAIVKSIYLPVSRLTYLILYPTSNVHVRYTTCLFAVSRRSPTKSINKTNIHARTRSNAYKPDNLKNKPYACQP